MAVTDRNSLVASYLMGRELLTSRPGCYALLREEKQRRPVPREGGLALVLVGIYVVCRVGLMEVAREAGKAPVNCSRILHSTELP